jgi:hypothetical protein
MAARSSVKTNLEEAIALLINNQAAFLQQLARNDQERLNLQLRTEQWQYKTEDWQRKTEDWQQKTEDWQRNAEKRFERIEERLDQIEKTLTAMPETILEYVLDPIVQAVLEQLPKAIKKEIGFARPRK